MPGVRSRPDAIAIPPSERRLLFRLQAEHALYPALSQSPPAPAHNPLSLPVSLPHPRLAPSAGTLVMVVCLLPGGTQVCPSGRSQPPDSGSSPGGNRPLRLRHHHTAGGEDTETLALRLAHRIQNDSVAKKAAAATTQPSIRALVRQQPLQLAPAGNSITRFFNPGFGATW